MSNDNPYRKIVQEVQTPTGVLLQLDSAGNWWVGDTCVGTFVASRGTEDPNCYYHPQTGDLAVLYCPRISPGWSTYRSGFVVLATDKQLVELVLNKEPHELAVVRVKELGIDMSYDNIRDIFQSLKVEWIPRGEYYMVQKDTSCIGSEHIIRQHNMKQA